MLVSDCPVASRAVEERYEAELDRAGAVLDSVDEALTRLDEGAYGCCATCGSAIADVVLDQDPTRSLCEQHLPLSL
jgi:RNA polymerase-binding transcription factor DksA